MTSREAALLLGVSPKTVLRLAQAGDLPAVRLGPHGRWRIIRAHVDAMVRAEPVQSKYGLREATALTMLDDLGGDAA